MSNYYFYAIILNGCPYSEKAYKLLKNKNKNYQSKRIDYSIMDKYKTNEIQTFPQIYLKRKDKNGSLLIGGYTDLENIYDTFYKKECNKNVIDNYIKEKNLSRKILLRIIELINN
jgi:hypothetical protein